MKATVQTKLCVRHSFMQPFTDFCMILLNHYHYQIIFMDAYTEFAVLLSMFPVLFHFFKTHLR